MDYSLTETLRSHFPTLRIETDFPLAPLTTIGIGGPADIYIETKTNKELVNLLKFISHRRSEQFFSPQRTRGTSPKVARTAKIRSQAANNLPIIILGAGSNIIISDSGIRGIVIKNLSNKITIHSSLRGGSPTKQSPTDSLAMTQPSTHRTENEPQKYLNFAAIDYDESSSPTVDVTLDAGVSLPFAINYLLDHGITGLQWFAYIPGTIGGAAWANLHGGKYHFSSYIKSVEYFDLSKGTIKKINFNETHNQNKQRSDEIFRAQSSDFLPKAERGREHEKFTPQAIKQFDYESSPFKSHPDWIILSLTLTLYLGDVARARQTALSWIDQKSKIQPMNSAGCTFQNPPLKFCLAEWGEQKSTGWIIDHELGLKGHSIGGAQISTQHSNFIINANHATAKDYLALVKLVQSEFQKRWRIDLKLEVKFLGEF